MDQQACRVAQVIPALPGQRWFIRTFDDANKVTVQLLRCDDITNIYAGRSSFSFAPIRVNFGLFPFKTDTVFPTIDPPTAYRQGVSQPAVRVRTESNKAVLSPLKSHARQQLCEPQV